jgi:hypothetical protein
MRNSAIQVLTTQIVTLEAQLAWADASILRLVEVVELLDRSVHQFEATHPATSSDQVQHLLQQIRQSRPGPPPELPPPPTLQRPPRRRNTRRHAGPRIPCEISDALTPATSRIAAGSGSRRRARMVRVPNRRWPTGSRCSGI